LSLSALRRQPIDSWQVFCLGSPNGGYNQLLAGVPVNPTAKTVVFWLMIALASALAYQVAHSPKSGATPGISFSEFLSQVDQGNVSEVTILGQEVRGRFKNDKTRFHITTSVQPAMMVKELQDKGVNVTVREAPGVGWPARLRDLAPFVLLPALWFIMVRLIQRTRNSSTSSLGKGGPVV
jgi:cell division protease FtsH